MNKIILKQKLITITKIADKYNNGKWVVPIYQRNYVWDDKKTEQLNESLIRNFPIGSILINKQSEDHYEIMDGQQRIKTLLRIRKNPFKFISDKTFEYLFSGYIESRQRGVNEIAIKNVKNKLTPLTEANFKEKDEYGVPIIIQEVTNILWPKEEPLYTSDEIYSKKEFIKGLVKYSQKLYDYEESIKIPTIIVKGAKPEEIVEIFNRINTSGIPLTNFEKLSAKWSKYKIQIEDKKLSKSIENLYSSDSERSGIIDHRENNKTNNYSPSEFLYSIFYSALLKQDKFFQDIFLTDDRKLINMKQIDKLLYLLKTFFLSKNNLSSFDEINNDDLGKMMNEYFISTERIDEFERNINNSFSLTFNSIPLLSKKNIFKASKYYFDFMSKNLLVSLISQVMKNEMNGNSLPNVYKNLQYNMIIEILNNSYSSSTNTRLIETIQENKYLKSPKKKVLEIILDNIQNMQLETSNYIPSNKNAIRLINAITFNYYEPITTNSKDHDHIIPKGFLKEQTESFSTIGMNSIGNHGIIKSSENRSKGKVLNIKLLAEDQLPSICNFSDEIKDKYFALLSDTNNDERHHDVFRNVYEFRYKYIKEKFISMIIDD